MDNLRLLYLSYNMLTEIPANLPPNVIELRFHENNINRIQKDAFKGLRKLHVLGETRFQLISIKPKQGRSSLQWKTETIRLSQRQVLKPPKNKKSGLQLSKVTHTHLFIRTFQSETHN